MQGLFSPRLHSAIRWVCHRDDEFIIVEKTDVLSQVKSEWQVTARMRTNKYSVQPDVGLPIHRAKVEQNGLSLPFFRDCKGTEVP